MKIYIWVVLLGVICAIVTCQQKSTRRSVEVPAEVPIGGHWATKSQWKAHWVKHWVPKTIYIPVWKKVWTPISINEWIPYAPLHHR
nr:uncharacterized protein LOC111421619 [Onthophagus taurus]